MPSACLACNVDLSDIDAQIKCSQCQRIFHKRCARSVSGGADDVPLSSDAWVCPFCAPSSRSTDTIALSNMQFNALMCQLSTINSTIADLRNDQAACRQDISSLRDENSLLRDRVSYLENRPFHTSLLSEEV
ncbi:hypothetical protein JTB14_002370 [Gonioctena quinquepunctata]|nr:hypothetical protein JTB14_002370 [Gonioctena quinquepunctata]